MTALVSPIRGMFTVALLALASTACTSPPLGNCTGEQSVLLTPRDTSVVIGAAFQARISVSTCGGRRVRDTFTWSSLDLNVARVHTATGRVTAVGVGETSVDVVGARAGRMGRIRIVVTR